MKAKQVESTFQRWKKKLGEMKTIVYVNGEKHSAWQNEAEAIKQIEVLGNSGYKNCYL